MLQTPTQHEAQTTALQFLVFDIAGEEYALQLTETREIIKTPDITTVPNAPAYVAGVANLRGQVLTVIDMQTLFGLQSVQKAVPVTQDTTEPKSEQQDETAAEAIAGTTIHTIVVEKNGTLYGLQVQNAKEVLRTDADSVQQTPDVIQGHAQSHYLRGVIVLDASKQTKEVSGKVQNPQEVKTRIILALDLEQVLHEAADAHSPLPS